MDEKKLAEFISWITKNRTITKLEVEKTSMHTYFSFFASGKLDFIDCPDMFVNTISCTENEIYFKGCVTNFDLHRLQNRFKKISQPKLFE